jgi:hypothetical protein
MDLESQLELPKTKTTNITPAVYVSLFITLWLMLSLFHIYIPAFSLMYVWYFGIMHTLLLACVYHGSHKYNFKTTQYKKP